jgi:5-methyltetrahydropteroyltriglutamate--homocysteine methyltransferase
MADRILTTHTGSLPRPDALREGLYAMSDGRAVDAGEWRALVERATDEVVLRQVEAGIDVVSDGELAKPGFTSYVIDRLTGFERFRELWPLPDLEDLPELFEQQYGGEAGAHLDRARCVGPVAYVGQERVGEELRRFRAAVDRAGARAAFVPAISPGLAATMMPNVHYPADEYLGVLADVLAVEYRMIVEAGFLLQLDCPDIPMMASMMPWEAAEPLVARHVEALNQATAGLPPERMRMHLCWGNWEGPHRYDVPLRQVLPSALRARPAAISFEAANARHAHEWRVFEDLKIPEGKILMPGVVDTKCNVVEHPELVAERIERFAGLVGRENLIPGTDCGFGTFAGFGVVHPKVAWMKLAALGEGARLASRRLWP